jgi:protease PrsW
VGQYSIPIHRGWRLRVTSGNSAGKEFDLVPGRYVIGSKQPSSIVIPDPSIAPQHVVLVITANSVQLSRAMPTAVIRVNGIETHNTPLRPGDDVLIGTFGFQMVNPSIQAAPAPIAPGLPLGPGGKPITLDSILKFIPVWIQVFVGSGTLAFLLLVLFLLTNNLKILPAVLFAGAAVIPVTVLTFLVGKYDKTGISFKTLVVTFLLGGTLGIVATLIGGITGDHLLGGVLSLAMFAGVFEEPAKLLATFWRWRHPAYDRPMDGLLLGAASGFGFAVFETAGYGMEIWSESKEVGLVTVMIIRGILSPFGHGLWTALVVSAFWQAGRSIPKAVKAPYFWKSLLMAIGLHALWNCGADTKNADNVAITCGCIFLGMFISAGLSTWAVVYRLNRNGYC